MRGLVIRSYRHRGLPTQQAHSAVPPGGSSSVREAVNQVRITVGTFGLAVGVVSLIWTVDALACNVLNTIR